MTAIHEQDLVELDAAETQLLSGGSDPNLTAIAIANQLITRAVIWYVTS